MTMKKMISLALAACMALALAAPAGATGTSPKSNVDEVSKNDVVVLKENDDGTFTLIGAVGGSGNRAPVQGVTTSATVVRDQDMDILHLSGNQYLTKAYDNVYAKAERVDFNTESYEANIPLINEYDISDEYAQDIREIIESQKAVGNADVEISVYVGEEYPAVNADMTEAEYTTLAAAANENVKEDILEARNYLTPWRDVVRGKTARDVAKSIANLVVATGGLISAPVSLFGAGMTALAEYQNFFNKQITVPAGSDWQQLRFKFDWLKKTSKVNTPAGALTGCISQKLWIAYYYHNQFFAQVGKEHQTSKYVNLNHKSKSWDDSKAIALKNYHSTVIDPDFTTTIGGKQFEFSSSM